MGNLLQAIGQARPVSDFTDQLMKFQQVQDQSAFRAQEVQNLEQRRRIMNQQEEATRKEQEELHRKRPWESSVYYQMTPEEDRPKLTEIAKRGGYLDEKGEMSKYQRQQMLEESTEFAPHYLQGQLKVGQAAVDKAMSALDKAEESGDEVAIAKAHNALKFRLAKIESLKGAHDKVGTILGKAEGGPKTAGGVDPSVVRTFEAAHPELVSKRGTEEYGKALQAFIQSGERPYSTFVGLTPDGKQAITFDSRKGTVGLQPLPFEGQIQPKISPTVPTEQTTAFQQIGTLKEALGQVTDMYDDSFVGPIAGRAGKIQDNWGIMPDPKRAEFRALTANMYNTIIYLRSGKQINEEEAKRLLDELPTMNISPVAFQAKLKKFTWELNSIERGKMRQLKGAGYRNVPEAQGGTTPPPQGGTVKVWDPETKSFKVQ